MDQKTGGIPFAMPRMRMLTIFTVVAVVLPCASRGASADGPGHARAETLRFDTNRSQWVELPRPEPGTPAGDLALARSVFGDHEYARAWRLIVSWQKSYGPSSELHPEALLLQARIAKARREFDQAHRLLDQFLNDYRATDLADDAAVELFNVAEVYLSGVKRKLWGMRLLSGSDLALDILDRITTEFEGTTTAELALKTKGDYFFNRGDFALAELEYGRIVQEYPASRYRRYAARQAAAAALASFPGVRFDDAPLIEAEERYRQYAGEYGDHARQEGVSLILDGIRQRRADKEYEIGRYYEKIGQRRAAGIYFQTVIDRWPDSAAAAKASVALSGGQATALPDSSMINVPDSEADRAGDENAAPPPDPVPQGKPHD